MGGKKGQERETGQLRKSGTGKQDKKEEERGKRAVKREWETRIEK